jgi:hypothetical protein
VGISASATRAGAAAAQVSDGLGHMTNKELGYTVRRRRLSSITRAPCRKVMGVPGQRSGGAVGGECPMYRRGRRSAFGFSWHRRIVELAVIEQCELELLADSADIGLRKQ